MEKLIIVCDKETEKYANYLRQLISSNDDKEGSIVGIKDGSVDSVVWTEEQYKANSPTISSSQHILFVGNGKVAQNESASIKFVHDKFGMKYGWIGKRGVAVVDKTLNEEEYSDFLEYCKEHGVNNEKISFKLFGEPKRDVNTEGNVNDVKKQKESVLNDVLKSTVIATSVAGILGGISTLGAHGVKTLITSVKVKEQQYTALIVILYLNGLESFMES